MSALTLRLPDSLHEQVKVHARQDGISINQFIASAVAEKMSALIAEKHLRARAQAGSESDFYNVLSKVSATDPIEKDAL